MVNCTQTTVKQDAALVDIREVQVDRSLPKRERIAEYIRQIKDPYRFRCGDFTVTAKYAANGPTIEVCLERLTA